MTSTHRINIAGARVSIQVSSNSTNIIRFLDCFTPDITSHTDLHVEISESNERQVKISDDFSILEIRAQNIDELSNPYNFIGITQALLRASAIHFARNGFFLLHGSTAILNGKAICFGDNGHSSAKTLSSLELAMISGNYISDEFSFLDSKTTKIFGYPFIPIHFRPSVVKHIEQFHNVSLPATNFRATTAGSFIEPERLFQVSESSLDSLVYVHFSNKPSGLKKLTVRESSDSLKYCLAVHVGKLLYPHLDRMQFTSQSDTTIQPPLLCHEALDRIASDLIPQKDLALLASKFTHYNLIVSTPCQISEFLTTEIH